MSSDATAAAPQETAAGEPTKGQAPSHGHSRWLSHHFDTSEQQLYSNKLGMWIFLLTEILFFSGLFCAYAVYRRNNPQMFDDGHLFLDTRMGAINTAVLIFSSFTMALAVRFAQLSQRTALTIALGITLACGFVFLGVKYQEYSAKLEHRLLPGQTYYMECAGVWAQRWSAWLSGEELPEYPVRTREALGFHPKEHHLTEEIEKHRIQQYLNAARGPAADVHDLSQEQKQQIKNQLGLSEEELLRRANNLGSFFGIYFALTGLHALHVICGIIALTWLFVRSLLHHFGSDYFDPVECTGLYWHLVDLIWIYLFPLLYLID